MADLSTLQGRPQQLIRVACALRSKYRKGSKVRLPPCLVGFHPQNRGGAKLSGLRVLELTRNLLEKGFDDEEADCGGIVVECATMVMVYNANACSGDPLLIATVDGKSLQFGTLAHSHLNQVLKNIGGGLKFNEVESDVMKKLLDSDARIQLDMLRAHDETFARYIKEGLLFEVLAAEMDTEEPEAAEIISAAANVKNAMSLIPHEMEAIRLTSKHCSKQSQLAGDVAFANLRDQLAQSMPSIAYDPDFIHIFKFVIEVGAENQDHVGFLCDFLSKFVDPAKRRLRLSAFSVVTEVPAEAAHMRIALLVQAYCCPPKFQFCDGPNRQLWKLVATKHANLLVHAQALLFFFSDTKREELSKLTPFDRIRFLGNLYKDVANAFRELKQLGNDHVLHELQTIGSKCSARYAHIVGEDSYIPKELCLDAAKKKKESPDCPASSGNGAVKAFITEFDSDGKIIARPPDDSRWQDHGPLQEETLNWRAWQQDKEIKDLQVTATCRYLAYCICAQMWFQQPEPKNLEIVKPVIGSEKSKKWVVRALAEFAPGTLVLVPYVANAEKISFTRALHPDAIVVTVQSPESTTEQTAWICPDFSTKSDAEVKEKGDTKWVGQSRSLFWACGRSPHDKEWNCDFVDMKSSHTMCLQWNSVGGMELNPQASATVVTVPVIVNTRQILQGDAVVVKCPPPLQKPKKNTVKKLRTWEDDARAVIKKAK